MEMSSQLAHPTDAQQKPTSTAILHLPSIKAHSLDISDFLELSFNDSFSEILPHAEDDLDSLREVFDPVRDGPMDFLDNSFQCSSTPSTDVQVFNFQDVCSTVTSPDVNSSVSSCDVDYSDNSASPDSKDVLSRALQFSDLASLDAYNEDIHSPESRPLSDCCFSDSSKSSCEPSAVCIPSSDFQEELCRFSVSLSDLVSEPVPESTAFTHIPYPLEEYTQVNTEAYQPHVNTIIFQREQDIRQRFEALRMDYPEDIEQLCQFYMYQSAIIETERLHQTKPPCPSDHAVVLNQQYDNQLNQMLNRVEQSLCLLEETKIQKPKSIKPIRKQRVSFTKKAIEVMEDWYEKNMDHPYPDSITVELIAIQGEMTAEQVKKWFGNKRNRSNNTRSLTEIAKKKRQIAFNCFSELAL